MDERMNVLPTPMVQQMLKGKLKTAERGHDILKKKSEVLQHKFRIVGKDLVEIRELLGEIFKDSSFLVAEAKFVTNTFSEDVLNANGKARLKVNHTVENIAGVKLYRFQCHEVGKDQHELVGLAKGGSFLTKIKQTFRKAVEVLVDLATLQMAFLTLDEIIRATNQRVNALEHRYIPVLENTLKYVAAEIGEKQREDFYRMKKIQKLKAKHKLEKERILEELKVSHTEK